MFYLWGFFSRDSSHIAQGCGNRRQQRQENRSLSDRDPKVAENKQTMSHCVNCGQVQGDKCKFKSLKGVSVSSKAKSLSLNQRSGIETLLNKMIATFTDSSADNVKTFVDLISVSTPTELCTLKTEKKTVLIPKGAVIEVTCRANTGPLERKTPVLSEPLSEFELPYGLELSETLLCADKRSSSRLNVKVCNTANYDIRLKGRTVLGHLQLVKSVTPLEVKLKENSSLNDSPSDTENVTGYKVDEVEANASNSEPECLDGKHTPPDYPPVDLEGLTPSNKKLQNECCMKKLNLSPKMMMTLAVLKT